MPAATKKIKESAIYSALSASRPKEATMKRLVILALTLLTIAPAAAESAKSLAPGQHAKGTHGQPGASYYAPGHQKKRLHMQSSSGVSPGHKNKY